MMLAWMQRVAGSIIGAAGATVTAHDGFHLTSGEIALASIVTGVGSAITVALIQRRAAKSNSVINDYMVRHAEALEREVRHSKKLERERRADNLVHEELVWEIDRLKKENKRLKGGTQDRFWLRSVPPPKDDRRGDHRAS